MLTAFSNVILAISYVKELFGITRFLHWAFLIRFQLYPLVISCPSVIQCLQILQYKLFAHEKNTRIFPGPSQSIFIVFMLVLLSPPVPLNKVSCGLQYYSLQYYVGYFKSTTEQNTILGFPPGISKLVLLSPPVLQTTLAALGNFMCAILYWQFYMCGIICHKENTRIFPGAFPIFPIDHPLFFMLSPSNPSNMGLLKIRFCSN